MYIIVYNVILNLKIFWCISVIFWRMRKSLNRLYVNFNDDKWIIKKQLIQDAILFVKLRLNDIDGLDIYVQEFGKNQ